MISTDEIQVDLVVRTSDDMASEAGATKASSHMSCLDFRERGGFMRIHPSLDFGGFIEKRGRVTGEKI